MKANSSKLTLSGGILVLSAAVALSACGGSKNTNTKPTNTTAGTTGGVVGGNTGNVGGTGGTGGTTGAAPSSVPFDPAGPTSASTSTVTATVGGQTVAFKAAVYSVRTADGPTKWGVALLDYDPCNFGYDYGYSAFPAATFNSLGLYLVNQSGATNVAPTPGTYNVGTPAGTGLFIDPSKSGMGFQITECKAAQWPVISGGTVTITSLDETTKAVSGSVNLTLAGGGTISGDFGTAGCQGGGTTPPTPVTGDPNACTSLH
jgi:hypothetical protein